MIETLSGKVFFRMDCKYDDKFSEEIKAFLKAKTNISETELARIQKIQPKSDTLVGFKQEFETKDFTLVMTYQEDSVRLLFGTEMESDEFADLIQGYFE